MDFIGIDYPQVWGSTRKYTGWQYYQRGPLPEGNRKDSHPIVMTNELNKSRVRVKPEQLLLPAPTPNHDATQAANHGHLPEETEADILPIEPRSAELRAEDFLIDWVRRFSRA